MYVARDKSGLYLCLVNYDYDLRRRRKDGSLPSGVIMFTTREDARAELSSMRAFLAFVADSYVVSVN